MGFDIKNQNDGYCYPCIIDYTRVKGNTIDQMLGRVARQGNEPKHNILICKLPAEKSVKTLLQVLSQKLIQPQAHIANVDLYYKAMNKVIANTELAR